MELFDIGQLSVQDMLLVALIAEYGSVSSAANEIGVTQPTASYRLNKIREMFDDPIFISVNRRMNPTPLGFRILETFRQQVDGFKNLIEPVSFDPMETTRSFTIVSKGFFLPTILANLPQKFFGKTRNAKLIFEPSQPQSSINQQLHERADVFSWTFNPQGAKGIRRLVSPELKVFMLHDPRFCTPPETFEDFAQHRFVNLGPNSNTPGVVGKLLAKNGYPALNVAVMAPTVESVHHIVEGTDLIYCGTSLIGEGFTSNLKSIELPFYAPGLRHEVRWSLSKEKDPGHAWLLDIITRSAKEAAVPSMRLNPDEDFKVLTEYEML